MNIDDLKAKVKQTPIWENDQLTLTEKINAFRARMDAALDEIAEACGAWHCMNCGEWTREMVIADSHSDELGYETTEGCPRCVGGR